MTVDIVPKISTDSIPLSVVSGVPVTIRHGLGRQVEGWLVIWRTVPVDFHVLDPGADTRSELVLIPSASASVRIILL